MEYSYPSISNVSYLKGYDLLIDFYDGTTRIVDMSDSFSVPATHKYLPLDIFKNFGFDAQSVWWGDRESVDSWEVGHDSLYRPSIEASEFISSLSARIKLLAMSTVFHEKEPYDVLGRVRGGDYMRPHIRITYNDIEYTVRLDDVCIIDPKNVSIGIRRFIVKYVSKYRAEAFDYWIESNNRLAIQEAKDNNWPWWDEDGFPSPDPAELARASDYGDPFPFDKYMDEEDPVDD
jgi:hypothetical protein